MRTHIEQLHFFKVLDPVADAFDGTVASDVVNLGKGGSSAFFLIHKGVGATGTSTVTVEACDDFVPTTTSAIPFLYRAITSGDTPGAVTRAEAAGFTTTAGSSQIYAIQVPAENLAGLGYPCVRVKAVESVNSPVVGSIIGFVMDLKSAEDIDPTLIA